MNKEEFYSSMDELAAELYEKYVNELSAFADKGISKLYDDGHADVSNDVNNYILSRGSELKRKLQEDVDRVEKRADSLNSGYDKHSLGVSQEKLKLSFASIYEGAKRKIESLLR